MNLLDMFIRLGVDDQATAKLESIVTAASAKGNMLANAFNKVIGGIRNAAGAVYDFGSSIIGAYSQYEQNIGGIQTLFKDIEGDSTDAADTVIANAKRAFETAGVSMNQYMQQATSLASAMIQGVTKTTDTAAQASVDAASAALDAQYDAQQRAFSAQSKALQRQLSDHYEAVQEQYQQDYENYAELLNRRVEKAKASMDKALARLRATNAEAEKNMQANHDAAVKAAEKANEQQVRDFESASKQQLKIMEDEYEQRIALIDSETKAKVKAIDDQIKALEEQGQQEDDEEKQRTRAAKIAELERKTETEKTYRKREAARQELSEYLAKIEKEDADAERKRQIASLKEQRTEIKESAAEQKKDAKDQYDEQVSQFKDARSEELRVLKENQKEQLAALKEGNAEQLAALKESNAAAEAEMQASNSKRLSEMQKANQEELRSFQRANQQKLKELQRANEDQLTAQSQAQQDSLKSLQKSIAAQKKELQEAASSSGEYVEATQEDLKKAAEMVDMAIIDMSDNANKMGTDLGMIQAAYQGFSKQNFTMLDNLKLGFGGTKGEMERLLETAEQIKAKEGETVDYSIDSLADIVEAIHTVQYEQSISGLSLDEINQKLQDQTLTTTELNRVWQDNRNVYGDTQEGYAKFVEDYKSGQLEVQDAIILTGTTSKEANTTIEGSFRSMGAAWDNFLVALADPDTDIGEATDQLIERFAIAAENIVPRVGIILGKLKDFVIEKAPEVFEELKKQFEENIPEDMQERFGSFMEEAQTAFDTFRTVLDNINTAMDTVKGFLDWFDQNKDVIIPAVGGVTAAFVAFKAAITIAKTLTALKTGMEMVQFAAFSLGGGITELGGGFTLLSAGPIALVVAAIAGIIAALVIAYNTNEDFRKKVDSVFEAVRIAVGTAMDIVGQRLEDAIEFFGNLSRGAEGMQEMVQNAMDNVANYIEDFMEDPASALFDVGTAIVSGLINGIDWDIGGVADALWNGVMGAYNDVCKWLGIASPSKRMREVGHNIMAGMTLGIDDDADEPAQSMLKAAEGVLGASAVNVGMTVPGTKSVSASGGAYPSLSVIVDGDLVVREEADIDRIAERLYTKIRREQEAYGWSTSFTTA